MAVTTMGDIRRESYEAADERPPAPLGGVPAPPVVRIVSR